MQHKMEKWTNYSIIGALTFTLAISLGFNSIPDSNYYCDSRQAKAYCFELSSTLKTCYTLPPKTGGKLCNEGWQKIPEILTDEIKDEIKKPCANVAVISYTDLGKFYCDGIGESAKCVRWENLLEVS